MHCKYHQNIKANNICHMCKSPLCEDCVLEINGKVYCKDCLLQNKNLKNEIINTLPNQDAKIQTKNGLLTLIFSALPGCAQMYLGLYKRGILILMFFMASLGLENPILAIPILAFSFFDGFRIKSNLEKGIYQEDNLNDIKSFIKENKVFIFILALIIVVPIIFEFLEEFFEDIFGGFSGFLNRLFFACNLEDLVMSFVSLIVVFTIFLIVATIIAKMFSKDKRAKTKNNIDNDMLS